MFFQKKRKIDFLIIGAQKCGTTSLHYYLSQHPNLHTAKTKEVDFFSYDGLYKLGEQWYLNQFNYNKQEHKNKLLFEASPEYLYIPYVAERIYKYNPKIKLIVLTRNPVQRAVSAYTMYQQLNEGKLWLEGYIRHIENHNQALRKIMYDFLTQKNFPSFESAIIQELELINKKTDFIYEPSFLQRGNYSAQLDRFYAFFDKKQIMTIKSEEMNKNPFEILTKLTGFLCIEKFDFQKLSLEPKLVQNVKIDVSEKSKTILKNYFENN